MNKALLTVTAIGFALALAPLAEPEGCSCLPNPRGYHAQFADLWTFSVPIGRVVNIGIIGVSGSTAATVSRTMATTPAVTKAMEEKATGISGIMDIASNPAKKIGNAEAIDLSIFAENISFEF